MKTRSFSFRVSGPGPSALVLCALAALAGCSPELDWRQVRLENSEIGSLFPCRPEKYERSVELAGARATMRMLSCVAGGATYALAAVDLPTPVAVSDGLIELRSRSLANIGAVTPKMSSWKLAGSTPNPGMARLSATGHLPDGTPIAEYAVFFARGSKVYQGSVIGKAPDPNAIDAFFSGFKLG